MPKWLRNQNVVLMVFLSGVVIFTAIDMLEDASEGESALHLLSEFGILISCLLAIIWIWRTTIFFERRTRRLGAQLAHANAAAVRWRQQASEAIAGLGVAIDRQFDAWRLSPSEREVGMLILKGMALKEIAGIRSTSERTVRQQAQEAYRKAGLNGRAAFAAFFLEDLLLPAGSVPPTAAPLTAPS